MQLTIREPKADEFEYIYKMGFDVWSSGNSLEKYLDGCRRSSKYQQGQWFILEDNNGLLSSLLMHSFGESIFGIGSIATEVSKRKNGYASALIEKVLENLEAEKNFKLVYLYSDIEPKFYERFGFIRLPPELQKYSSSTCMVRFSKEFRASLDRLNPPDYF
jgi:predicted acetyltransferase